MPADNWRVMLFEKIEFLILQSSSNEIYDDMDQSSMIYKEYEHKSNLNNTLFTIKQVKKNYAEMLHLYKDQLEKIGKYEKPTVFKF